MSSTQYQLPQQPPPSQPTGELLNTNPAPQMPADKNVASLSMPANQAMSHLAFANNMLHHLIQYKAGKNKKDLPQPQELQENPQEEATETPKEEKQETPDTQAKMNKLELDWSKKFDDLRKELDEKHKLELDNLRNDIKSALEAEENNE